MPTAVSSLAGGGSTNVLDLVTEYLYFGKTHAQVKSLQQILNSSGYRVSLLGLGSPGFESTYFGPATLKALQTFQCRKLTLCSGVSSVTGYGATGPKTRALLNSLIATTTKRVVLSSVIITTSVKTVFTRALSVGSTGTDVKNLQIFLNSHGFVVTTSGTGSIGKESTYFGPATAAALAQFQQAYASDILIPAGLTKGTGFFGTATMKKINDMQ